MQHYCKKCRALRDTTPCPVCNEGHVSASPDTMDALVAAASVPNLASLFKQAKKAGVIDAVSAYGEGAATT